MPEKSTLGSLVGVVSPLLTVDTRDARAIDYNSLWQPRQWKKSTPFVIDMQEIQPLGNSGLNFEINFEIPKLATLMSDMILRTIIPPSTVSPVGVQASYVDHLGFAQIDYFRDNYGSNQVYTREAQDLYFKYRAAFGIEKTFAYNQMVLGDTTTAQRNAFLLSGGELLTPLMQPFSAAQFMAQPLITVSQKSRYTFKSRAFNNLTVVPAGAPATTITNNANQWLYTLRCMFVHTTGNEGAYLLKLSQQSDGISYMIHQNIRQSADDFVSTQNNFVINEKLSNFTKPLRILYWALIPTKLQNDTGRNDIFMYSPTPTPVPQGMTPYNPIDHWNIEANGQIIQRDINPLYNQVYLHQMYHESFPGKEIFFQTYEEFPHSVNASTGFMDYTNLNNPVLKITMGAGGTGIDPDTGGPQSLRVVLNGEDFNFWFFNRGNWARAFN